MEPIILLSLLVITIIKKYEDYLATAMLVDLLGWLKSPNISQSCYHATAMQAVKAKVFRPNNWDASFETKWCIKFFLSRTTEMSIKSVEAAIQAWTCFFEMSISSQMFIFLLSRWIFFQ